MNAAARTAIAWTIVIAIGCSKEAPAPPAAQPSLPATSPTTGTVMGTAPAPDSSGAVVVVLEPRPPHAFPPQTDKPLMDQVGLTFGPELLFVRTGQPVDFRNSDDTLHNVNVKHEETREQAFNVAIPTGASYEHTFTRDGFYRVGCDIHPAMAASIFSSTTPFAALAAADGRFTFAEVPRGSWTVTIYAGGRRLQRDIEVTQAVTEVTVE